MDTPLSQVCTDLATSHYENFPVGRFVSKSLRPHIHAIYAFARVADDFADEPQYEGRRLQLLSGWRKKLYEASKGSANDPIFKALAQTMQTHHVPVVYLDQLIQAFEYDVEHATHSDFDSLLTYSSKSANPVGRIFLWIHGYREEKLFELSDHICTALQLTNFWQDVEIDLLKPRVYIPQTYMQKYGYTLKDLQNKVYNESYRHMLTELGEETFKLFERGRPLCNQFKGKLAFELKLIWNGGYRILRSLQKNHYNVFQTRPKLTLRDKGWMFWKTLSW